MSSRNFVRIGVSSLLGAALVGGLWVGGAGARGGGTAGGTAGMLASAAPGASQLHDVADALAEQGRAAHADTFTGVSLEAGRVHLWATSLPAARAVLDDAHRAHPGLDMAVVDLSVGRFSRARLDAGARALMGSATARAMGVQSAAPLVDGSGVQVSLLAARPGTRRATNLPAALAALTRITGVPVAGTVGGPVTAAAASSRLTGATSSGTQPSPATSHH